MKMLPKCRPSIASKTASLLPLVLSLSLPLPLIIAGCAMEVENTRPARALKTPAQPTGVVYAGWRVFQDKCAACHGTAATGSEGAPDLLPRVREMSARQFAALVLKRYDLDHLGAMNDPSQDTTDTRVNDLLQRKDTPMTMPAWQGEPSVNAHIIDLYAYLSARAEGALGSGRPPR